MSKTTVSRKAKGEVSSLDASGTNFVFKCEDTFVVEREDAGASCPGAGPDRAFMAKKFTRRFDPDGPRNSEAEISEYDHLTRSPVVDPNIADWSPQWTVDPHIADMNAADTEKSRAAHKPSIGPVITVAGGKSHEIYHIAASCSVLTKDLALARRGATNARIDSKSLSAARRTGLACIVCLPEVARSRGDSTLMKACTITTDTGQRHGTLLHWRRDDRNEWCGLVVYDNGTGECEVVPAGALRERAVAPFPGVPQTPPKSAGVQANVHTGSGWVAPHDLASARRYHQRSATAGNTDSMRELALLLAYRTDPPDLTGARHWWELAAADGDPSAMFHLARLHATLLDPPDLASARRWYERAATNGDVDAMRELGTLLVDRLDEPDIEAAIHWWEKSAATGDYQSMIKLGLLLGFRLIPYTSGLRPGPPLADQSRRSWLPARDGQSRNPARILHGAAGYRQRPPVVDTGRYRRHPRIDVAARIAPRIPHGPTRSRRCPPLVRISHQGWRYRRQKVPRGTDHPLLTLPAIELTLTPVDGRMSTFGDEPEHSQRAPSQRTLNTAAGTVAFAMHYFHLRESVQGTYATFVP